MQTDGTMSDISISSFELFFYFFIFLPIAREKPFYCLFWRGMNNLRFNYNYTLVYLCTNYLCALRLPIDWKTPFGYLFVVICEAICAFYTTIFCACNLGFPVAFCWILLAFAKDIYFKLIALNKYHKNINDKNDSKFIKTLIQLIQMHQNGKL